MVFERAMQSQDGVYSGQFSQGVVCVGRVVRLCSTQLMWCYSWQIVGGV